MSNLLPLATSPREGTCNGALITGVADMVSVCVYVSRITESLSLNLSYEILKQTWNFKSWQCTKI